MWAAIAVRQPARKRVGYVGKRIRVDRYLLHEAASIPRHGILLWRQIVDTYGYSSHSLTVGCV